MGCTCGIYKQNERCIVLIPQLEIGDFVNRDKARNAFLTRGFLPSDVAKLQIIFHCQLKCVIIFTKQCERPNEILASRAQYKRNAIIHHKKGDGLIAKNCQPTLAGFHKTCQAPLACLRQTRHNTLIMRRKRSIQLHVCHLAGFYIFRLSARCNVMGCADNRMQTSHFQERNHVKIFLLARRSFSIREEKTLSSRGEHFLPARRISDTWLQKGNQTFRVPPKGLLVIVSKREKTCQAAKM